jgi:hypothetical protein
MTRQEAEEQLKRLLDMIEPVGPWKAHTRRERIEIRKLKKFLRATEIKD